MAQAWIVDALRTPVGRRRGGLAHYHAADLGAGQALEWAGISPGTTGTAFAGQGVHI